MSLKTDRVCVYPKDIQRITGKSEKSGQRMLKKIRVQLGKEDHQFVTADEFASYSGISLEIIQEYLAD